MIFISKWLNSSIGSIIGTLTGTTTKSIANEGIFLIPQTPGLQPHYQMHLYPVIPRIQFEVLLTCGVWRVLGSQALRARLCCRKISDSIFWLYYFTPRWLAGGRRSTRNIQKGKIETDRRRKHFFHTFLYLLGEWTNQRYVPRHSVVPKTPDSKIGVVGSTSLPEKRSGHRKPEYLSLFTGSKFATPKSF